MRRSQQQGNFNWARLSGPGRFPADLSGPESQSVGLEPVTASIPRILSEPGDDNYFYVEGWNGPKAFKVLVDSGSPYDLVGVERVNSLHG